MSTRSTHFLFDAHTTGPVTAAKLRDVRRSVSTSPTRGQFIIRVSDDLPLEYTPNNVSDLINLKYATLMSAYPTFGSIVFDELSQSPAIDPTPGTGHYGATIGERGTICLQPGGFVRSTLFPLGLTPSQVVFTWEAFTIDLFDYRDNIAERIYTDQAASVLAADVSFDAGTNFSAVSDGALFNVPVPVQGASLIVRFTNASVFPVWLASWALVY